MNKVYKTRWVNQFKEIESASKFHNHVREIFTTEAPFKNFRCYQEINVRDLVPDYSYNNHHFDWYIEELNTVLELHGKQHYQVTNYGNIGYDTAVKEFYRQRYRDNAKQQAAISAGYSYCEVPYTYEKKLNGKLLMQLLLGEHNE